MIAILLMGAALVAPAPASASASADSPASAAFHRLSALAGNWSASAMTPDGESMDINYKVTAGGSAIVETQFAGTSHEMVTVYYMDGDDLVLTHYCVAQNQPHMRLDVAKSTKDELHFVFAGGSNVDPNKGFHMHNLTVRFHGDGTVDTQWDGMKDGKPDHVAKMFLKKRVG